MGVRLTMQKCDTLQGIDFGPAHLMLPADSGRAHGTEEEAAEKARREAARPTIPTIPDVLKKREREQQLERERQRSQQVSQQAAALLVAQLNAQQAAQQAEQQAEQQADIRAREAYLHDKLGDQLISFSLRDSESYPGHKYYEYPFEFKGSRWAHWEFESVSLKGSGWTFHEVDGFQFYWNEQHSIWHKP